MVTNFLCVFNYKIRIIFFKGQNIYDNSGILVPFVAHDGTACSGGLVPCVFSPRKKA